MGWFFNTPWYLVTMTMVIILVLWDITNTRIDEEDKKED